MKNNSWKHKICTFLKSFYYKEIQKEKKETGKVERALAIPGFMKPRSLQELSLLSLREH